MGSKQTDGAEPPAENKSLARSVTGILERMAEKYGGATTVNELRVFNCLIRLLHDSPDRATFTNIRDITAVPKSTVSRALAKLRADGLISERTDPADARRRVITSTRKYRESWRRDVWALSRERD